MGSVDTSAAGRVALTVYEIAPCAGSGLVILDSQCEPQLRNALSAHSLEVVTLLASSVAACTRALDEALERGDAALVTTEATTEAAVDVLRRIPEQRAIGWILACGTPISRQIAASAFATEAAEPVGDLFRGLVTVSRLGGGSRRPAVPYVELSEDAGDDALLGATLSSVKGW
jgi:hypothetical protein